MGSTAIGVLGPLTVEGSAAGLSPRDRVVLAALALHPGEVTSAERLADALWGEQPPASWNKVVPGCVMRLRRVLGADVIETVAADGYRLVVSGEAVDVQRFERLVGRARELLTLGEPERAAHLATEALGLWRGRPLGDLERWDAGRIAAARLEELRLDAEELRLDASLRVGRYRDVLAEAQTGVAEAPLRERRWALLATAQYQAGRQGEALRTLHRARIVLTTELGIDPGPELVDLEQAILQQDASLVAREVGPEPTTNCPYLGLVPYDVSDAEAFFGRDAEVTECLARLATAGVLVVVGPSGSGKSSLVRAGVAAALVRDGRRVVIVTPGGHPMDALTAVPDSAPAPVLVVDQCEQAVTLCRDGAEQSRFFAALAERAQHAPLVVAMRADRLGDVTTQVGFARLVERGLHLLAPMAEADLRSAIEGPANQAGLLLEAGLVDLLVREVEGEPGALPLLSHALRQTWERREGRTLTVAGYNATGGIRAAVARSAEELYEGLAPEQRDALRDLLLRLVQPTVDGDPVPSPIARRAFLSDPEHDYLVNLLVDARLVTSDDGIVELSHESLARGVAPPSRLARGRRGRPADPSTPLGRRRLLGLDGPTRHGAVSRGPPPHRPGMARRAVHATRPHDDGTLLPRRRWASLRRGDEASAPRTTPAARLVAAVAVLVVAVAFAGLVAVRQVERAEVQAERADVVSVTADARGAAALALDADRVDQALLLGVEAVGIQDSSETRAALLAGLLRSPALIASYHYDNPSPANSVLTVRPNGETLIAGGAFTAVEHDPDTLVVGRRLNVSPSHAEFRPDGEQLALSPQGPTDWGVRPVHLLNGATLEAEPVQLGGWPAGVVETRDLDYSADGGRVAADLCIWKDYEFWDFTCTVTVWDLAAPEQPLQRIEAGPVWAVALSGDGSRVYVGSYEAVLDVYDVASGAILGSIPLTPDLQAGNTPAAPATPTAHLLDLSPDGTTLAVRADNDIVLLDAQTLTERARLLGHQALVKTMGFSHDGTRLASGDDDGAIIVWDLATGAPVEQLAGHTELVQAVAFAGDDNTLYSTAADRTLLAWDLRGDRRFIPRLATAPDPDRLPADASPPVMSRTAPDGENVAYFYMRDGLFGGTLRFFDVDSGRLGEAIETDHVNWSYSWRPPEFEEFVTGDLEGFVHVWDPRRGTMTAERQVTSAGISALSHTPDGSEIVGLDGAGSIFRLDADTLEQIAEPIPLHNGTPGGVVVGTDGDFFYLGPDGRTAVAVLNTGASAWVDLAEGRILHQADFGLEPARAGISPDGRRLAVAANTGEVGLLELDSWEWVRPPIAAHAGWALNVSWAADGTVFASGGQDGRVILWDGRTGERLGTVLPLNPEGWGATAFFDTDGHTVIIGTSDYDLFAWDTRLEKWIERACAIAGRDLTTDEWRNAFGDRPYHETCPADADAQAQ